MPFWPAAASASEELIRRQEGVLSTRVGYAGGSIPNATYRNHGYHAEAVEIIFDPARISYGQGNDVGASYRSMIFCTSDEQKRIAGSTCHFVRPHWKPEAQGSSEGIGQHLGLIDRKRCFWCHGVIFHKGDFAMTPLMKTLVAAAAAALLVADAVAQSTVVDVDHEPAPGLTVLPPLPGPLAKGVVFIPYRLENLRIVPVGGASARELSPRVGHLHITLDELPWQWADYGGSNTVILVGLPHGEHKVRIEAVDPEGKLFVARTVSFTVPNSK